MNHYDAVIIGFGKAGKTLAPQIAAGGRKVAIIERSPLMYGGTCPNVGCVPSKALILKAKNAGKCGTTPEERQRAYREAILAKNSLTATLRSKMHEKMLASGVEVIDGEGSFAAPDILIVKNGDQSFELTADKFFINTGATSFIPPIKGINGPGIYTSETMMNLERLPEVLAIIGGGFIGLEFASMYANFGSKVVILQDQAEFLPREDKDIADAIFERLRQQGIDFRFGVKVNEIADSGHHPEIKYTEEGKEFSLKADAVLVATGRRPNTRPLNPENAEIELTPNGGIKVNDKMQTSNPNIWAMGDVTGGLQFTYISLDDSRIVHSQLLNDDLQRSADDRKNIPSSVFIDPPYSRIGLNEKEAQAQNLNIKVFHMPAAAAPRAKAAGETTGLLKAIVDADTSQILGMMLFCIESYEMINLVELAMNNYLPYTTLRDMIYTHPAMSESFNDLFAD